MAIGRRGFLASLVGAIVTPWESLVDWHAPAIPTHVLMARIQITNQIMKDVYQGAFVAALNAEHTSLLKDIMRREESLMR